MIYCGFFRRALAFIIDTLLITIATSLIFIPVLGTQLVNVQSPDQMSALQQGTFVFTILSWQVVSLVLTWLYFALQESSSAQATLGKRILGMKVIGKDGGRISFARATGRFFSKSLSYIIFQIGFIMAGFTSRKRALHDMIAETYVVKKSFEQGQELPETKSHKLLLSIVCVLWVGLVVGTNIFFQSFAMSPTQSAAQQAALRLGNLAKQHSSLQQPVRLDGASFYQTAEGYRAVVVDPASNNKFTLFLQNGTDQICCQSFPLGDCAATGFVPCEE